jgi:acyl-CoA synthetase (AMP-forming)/AMP-acid ligase II
MTILDLLAASVRDRADHTAIVIDGLRITYAQLEERTRRVAASTCTRAAVIRAPMRSSSSVISTRRNDFAVASETGSVAGGVMSAAVVGL